MKKIKILLLCSSMLLLAACSSGGGSNTSTIESSAVTSEVITTSEEGTRTLPYSLSQLQTKFGSFKITPDTSTGATIPTYDSETNCYLINVASEKSTYTLKGYFNGSIRIINGNALTSYKKVKLELEGACIVSTNSTPAIEYAVDSKNVEIKSNNNSTNYVIATDSSDAIRSYNNIVFGGKGTLNIWTFFGHGIRASEEVRFHSSPTINISSGHDGIHCENFNGYDGTIDGTDYEAFTGTLNFSDIVSQAFDCESSSFTGSFYLPKGSININNAESVFKTDVSIIVNGSVVATNISGDPVVKNPDYSGTLTITVGGTFKVNGSDFTQKTL